MEKKTIVMGSDHAGYLLKNTLRDALREEGYTVIDCGTDSEASCDYPIYAKKVADTILEGKAELGILCCGTGIGMSMVANKIHGIRAACCSDTFSARLTRCHNDANILCMGARVVGQGVALDLAHSFLEAEYEGGKHARRVAMMMDIEKNQ